MNYRWNPLLRDTDLANYEFTPPSTAYSVTPDNIVVYGSVNMPEDVASTALTGGAVDFTKRVVFYDLTANDTVNAVSSVGTDQATRVQIMVRDPSGAVQTPGFVNLNTPSTNPVLSIGSVTASHFLAAVISGGAIAGLANPAGTNATGDVAVYRNTPVVTGTSQAGGSANTAGTTPPLFRLAAGQAASVSIGQIVRMTGGTAINQLRQIVAVTGYGTDVVAVSRDWGANIPGADTYVVLQGMLFESTPNPVRAITRMFATSAADVAGTGAQRIYYEKVFAANNNLASALTSAQIQIASDTPTLPSGTLLDIGLTAGLVDAATIVNRLTAPAGITFTTQPAFINIPAPGNLPPVPGTNGSQGIWVRLTLPAGSASYTGAANFRVQGTTT